jgi:hypothetical protein
MAKACRDDKPVFRYLRLRLIKEPGTKVTLAGARGHEMTRVLPPVRHCRNPGTRALDKGAAALLRQRHQRSLDGFPSATLVASKASLQLGQTANTRGYSTNSFHAAQARGNMLRGGPIAIAIPARLAR